MIKRSRKAKIATILVLLGVVVSGGLYFKKNEQKTIQTAFFQESTTQYGPTDPSALCNDCNVLLLVADTLRADYLSSYGYSQKTSPNIDQLANEGFIFRNNYANIPFTPPSHWSIMTGWYPDHHKLLIPSADESSPSLQLPDNMPLLPLIMKSYDYSTAGFVSSPSVGFLADYFDKFIEFDEQNDPSRLTGFRKTTNASLDWLEKNKDEKFFLFIHFWDPHSPYEPISKHDVFKSTQLDQLSIKAAKYAGEIQYMDSKIGELLNEIKKLELEKDTLILFTSDHGENFGEYPCDDFTWNSGPCEDHSVSVLDPEIKIPLIIKIPGMNAKKIESISQSVDLLPTILDLVGIPQTQPTDGSSLLDLIGGDENENRFAYSIIPKNLVESNIYTSGLRWKEWKLIRVTWIDDKTHQNKFILRLHNTTLGEKENFLAKEPDLVKKLLQQIEVLEAETPLQGLREENLDDETIKMLKSLGYL